MTAKPTAKEADLDRNLPQRLALALEQAGVRYCQWKGFWRPLGDSDADLLVHREDRARFRNVAESLGFKPVLPSGERQLPGVESFLGHEPRMPRPLHIHVHYQLVLGDYWRSVYRIPIEDALLASAVPGTVFPVPSPVYQFLVYLLRMMLRLRGWPFSRPRWLGGIQGQLDYFDGRCNRDELAAVLAQQLPTVDLALVDRCLEALRGETDPLEAALVRLKLYRRLKAHVRRPSLVALITATIEKILPPVARPMLFDGRMRPAAGGLVLALAGGDGAGKSTCAHQLRHWLSGHLPTLHAHLGRPPRSLLTLLVGAALKAEAWANRLVKREPPAGSTVELLRHLCTARDRYRLYQKARRFAASGGVAVCERYPIHEDRILVGPCIPEAMGDRPGRLALLLAREEERYYQAILPPDLICVLRLEPELAVKRKPEEPADYVRRRARVVWETKWSRPSVRVIDASRSLAEVVVDLKNVLWSAL